MKENVDCYDTFYVPIVREFADIWHSPNYLKKSALLVNEIHMKLVLRHDIES